LVVGAFERLFTFAAAPVRFCQVPSASFNFTALSAGSIINVPATAFAAAVSATYGRIIPRDSFPNSRDTELLVTEVWMPGLIITWANITGAVSNPKIDKKFFMYCVLV